MWLIWEMWAYTVVDPIVGRVRGNVAITQLLADPSNLEQLSSPATLEFLTGLALPQLLASEALGALLADPAKLQQLLGDPAALARAVPLDLLPILANPSGGRALSDQSGRSRAAR